MRFSAVLRGLVLFCEHLVNASKHLRTKFIVAQCSLGGKCCSLLVPSVFSAQNSVLITRGSVFSTDGSEFNFQHLVFSVNCSLLDVQVSTFGVKYSAPSSKCS